MQTDGCYKNDGFLIPFACSCGCQIFGEEEEVARFVFGEEGVTDLSGWSNHNRAEPKSGKSLCHGCGLVSAETRPTCTSTHVLGSVIAVSMAAACCMLFPGIQGWCGLTAADLLSSVDAVQLSALPRVAHSSCQNCSASRHTLPRCFQVLIALCINDGAVLCGGVPGGFLAQKQER